MKTHSPLVRLPILLSCLSALALSGCASVHPCDGKHGGICTSPRSVWGITRNRDQVNPTKSTLKTQKQAVKLLHQKPAAKDELPSISPGNTVNREASLLRGPAVAAGSPPGPVGNPQIAKGQMPLLTQPKVIRIWIAPWSHGNTLHFPGYLYRVVQPEQWRYAPSRGTTPVPVP